MKYDILLLGKTKDSFLSEGIAEYCKRLKHYTSIQLKVLKVKNFKGSDQYIKEKEGEILLNNIHPASMIIALDAKGQQFSSEKFATLISQWQLSGKKHISFIIGGPLGLSDELLRRAEKKISLSQMTFTHDMVRLFLLEQLYRAYTINAGEKYHK